VSHDQITAATNVVIGRTSLMPDATRDGALPPAMQMAQLLGGFQISQALYVVAKLDIATQLDDGPKAVADLAAASGAQPEMLGRLIRTTCPTAPWRPGPHRRGDAAPLTGIRDLPAPRNG
jgi:hypothetical protein